MDQGQAPVDPHQDNAPKSPLVLAHLFIVANLILMRRLKTISNSPEHPRALMELVMNKVEEKPKTEVATARADRAFRILDACELLGISRATLWKCIKAGQIKTIKIAGRRLVPGAEILRLVSDGTLA